MVSYDAGVEKLLVPADKLLEHYAQLAQQFPKSHAVVHFPLHFLRGISSALASRLQCGALLARAHPRCSIRARVYTATPSTSASFEQAVGGYLTSLP